MSATVQQLVSALVDRIYPIGSIVCFSKDVDPNTSIGGVWTQIKDCFLLASGSKELGSKDGSSKVVMTRSVFGYPPPPDPEKVRTVTTDRVIYG